MVLVRSVTAAQTIPTIDTNLQKVKKEVITTCTLGPPDPRSDHSPNHSLDTVLRVGSRTSHRKEHWMADNGNYGWHFEFFGLRTQLEPILLDVLHYLKKFQGRAFLNIQRGKNQGWTLCSNAPSDEGTAFSLKSDDSAQKRNWLAKGFLNGSFE